MDSIYKKITVDDIEKILSKSPSLQYPKYHGEGIYEVSKGCFTGRLGMKMFNEAFEKHIKEYLKK